MKNAGFPMVYDEEDGQRLVRLHDARFVKKMPNLRNLLDGGDIAIGGRMKNHRVPVQGRLQVAIVLVLHLAERFEEGANVPPFEVMSNGVLEKVLERVLCF